jgi:hypothetical protein
MSDHFSPVVVDGRTTEEKVRELMGIGTEHETLDFKQTLDLTDPKSKLHFVKDCIAMMNCPRGGYLVIGVDGSGNPALMAEPIKGNFDSSALGDLIRKYVDELVNPVSQVHRVDGRDIVVIWVQPPQSLLPVMVAHIGQYDHSSGGTRVVLQPGTIYVREGTSNVTASSRHLPRLLDRYRQRVIDDTRKITDALLKEIVESRAAGASTRAKPPLLLHMDNESFTESLLSNLEDDDERSAD